MNYRLFALDMDGTVLQPDHQTILESDRTAIQEAIAAGYLFVPATGRMRAFIPQPILDMKGWRYAVTSNGAALYDRETDTVLHRDCLSTEIVRQIRVILDEFHVFFEMYVDGESFVEVDRLENATDYNIPEEDLWFFKHKSTAVPSLELLLAQGAELEKIYIPYIPATIHRSLSDRLATFDVMITSSIETNLEVNSKTATKGAALKILCDHLNIPMEAVIAMGDQNNDLQMLQAVGLGVAMGNGTPQVKAVADVVTAPHTEGGVGKALHTYLLQQEDKQMDPSIIIRKETEADYAAVAQVCEQAFLSEERPEVNEHLLVEKLRDSDAFVPALSLVAEEDGKVVGHILFTTIMVGDKPALALAPLSVLPTHQKKGIGTALMQEGHRVAKQLGFTHVVVLGHSDYYPRVGYQEAATFGIRCPFEVPTESFMALQLGEKEVAFDGVVTYAKEFFEV